MIVRPAMYQENTERKVLSAQRSWDNYMLIGLLQYYSIPETITGQTLDRIS